MIPNTNILHILFYALWNCQMPIKDDRKVEMEREKT